MTFEEALTFKATRENPFMHADVKMTIHITPQIHDEILAFFDFYKANKTTDDTARLFSKNNQYEVYAIGPRIEYQFYKKLS
ncbi:hypothetical protein [Pedobacter sp. JCM 36344]|uniref:hypothetical protein n=1 Tax=Pedobacter sp. JCM 36344 TaxID=3374280 RepID=UPI00397A4749